MRHDGAVAPPAALVAGCRRRGRCRAREQQPDAPAAGRPGYRHPRLAAALRAAHRMAMGGRRHRRGDLGAERHLAGNAWVAAAGHGLRPAPAEHLPGRLPRRLAGPARLPGTTPCAVAHRGLHQALADPGVAVSRRGLHAHRPLCARLGAGQDVLQRRNGAGGAGGGIGGGRALDHPRPSAAAAAGDRGGRATRGRGHRPAGRPAHRARRRRARPAGLVAGIRRRGHRRLAAAHPRGRSRGRGPGPHRPAAHLDLHRLLRRGR